MNLDGSRGDGEETVELLARERVEELLASYRPYLKHIAEAELPRQLRARIDSSDLVQETLLRAHRRFEQFAGSSDREFAGWLAEILRNQIIDATRYHRRQVRDAWRDQPLSQSGCFPKTSTASEAVRRTEAMERLDQALTALPETYREVILLRQEQDLTFEEIGRRMQRSADAARMLWGRAVMQLGKLMKPDG